MGFELVAFGVNHTPHRLGWFQFQNFLTSTYESFTEIIINEFIWNLHLNMHESIKSFCQECEVNSQPWKWIMRCSMSQATFNDQLQKCLIKYLLQVAVFVAPAVTIPFLLFAGFFVNLSAIPVYMRWISYLSFMRYSFEGSLIAVYSFNRPQLKCGQPYCHFRFPIKILQQFEVEQSRFMCSIMSLLVCFLLIRLVAYLALKWKLRRIRWFIWLIPLQICVFINCFYAEHLVISQQKKRKKKEKKFATLLSKIEIANETHWSISWHHNAVSNCSLKIRLQFQ